MRRISILLLLSLFLFSSLGCQSLQMAMARWYTEPGPPDVPEGVRAIRDIEFAVSPQGPLLLDLYLPEEPPGEALPVLLYVFGGGWMLGNKHQVTRVDGQSMATQGYAVVSSQYRLSSAAIFPAQIEDVKAAIRWIRVNADTYGLDGDRIGLWGPSAGGHLVALAGTSGDAVSLDHLVSAYPDVSTRVQAVVDFFGPTDLSQADAHRLDGGTEYEAEGSFAQRFVGGSLAENAELVQLANPINYVDAEDPPFLIVHGDADPTVPFHQSELLAAALEEAGVDVNLHRVEGGGHGRGGDFGSETIEDLVLEFLDSHLKPSRR